MVSPRSAPRLFMDAFFPPALARPSAVPAPCEPERSCLLEYPSLGLCSLRSAFSRSRGSLPYYFGAVAGSRFPILSALCTVRSPFAERARTSMALASHGLTYLNYWAFPSILVPLGRSHSAFQIKDPFALPPSPGARNAIVIPSLVLGALFTGDSSLGCRCRSFARNYVSL